MNKKCFRRVLLSILWINIGSLYPGDIQQLICFLGGLYFLIWAYFSYEEPDKRTNIFLNEWET